MRRCKYFIPSTVKCLMGQLPYVWNGVDEVPCHTGNPPCYTPVELDPYWKDIFDETNKRLYNINS